MAYSDFTLAEVRRQFGLVVDESRDLFGETPEVALPPRLQTWLETYLFLGTTMGTEKGRSEFLIAPLLGELKMSHMDSVGLFSGITFDVDPAVGLNGRCDYILTRNPSQLEITAPVCVAVEAKNENIIAGVPQCLAEMVAAQRFNGNEGEVFGAITSGILWRFLHLVGRTASVDRVEYPIQNPRKIFGILTRMVVG